MSRKNIMKRSIKVQKDFPAVVELYKCLDPESDQCCLDRLAERDIGELKEELAQLLAYAGAAAIVEAELARDRKAIERHARG